MGSEQNQNSPQIPTKNNIAKVIIEVFVILPIVAGLGFGVYYFLKKSVTASPQSTPSMSTSPTSTATTSQKTTTPSATSNWQKYSNVRFGFTVEAPADFTKNESQNGDGATFSNNSAATISIFGVNNSENLSLEQYLNKEYSLLQMETPDVKETANGKILLDGCQGEKRTWQYTSVTDGVKTVLAKTTCLKNNVFYALELTSSNSAYVKYTDTFDKITTSFKFK